MLRIPSRSLCIPLSALLLSLSAPVGAALVTREVTLDPGSLVAREVAGVTFLDLRGGATGLPEGQPDLPLYPVLLHLPAGTRAAHVRVVPLEQTELPGTVTLAAVDAPRTDGTRTPGLMDAAVAARNTWVPETPLAGVQGGRMRGESLVAVAVAPVSWHPGTGRLRFLTRFRVEVETEAAPPESDDLVVRRETPEGRESFSKAIATLTGDRAPLARDPGFRPTVNSGEPFAPTFRPSPDGSPVEMVIITGTDQAAEYQRLADFHTKTGRRTVVRTMDWIRANYPAGLDDPDTIRRFIKDAVAHWGTAWVLLGGDSGVLQPRYAHTTFYFGEDIPTDLYFSALDGSWSGDGDAHLGEGMQGTTVHDNVDLYPDVWVGRLTSNNVTEAARLVDKCLDYLQSPSTEHLNDYLFLAEVLFPENWIPGGNIQLDGAVLSDDVVDSLLPQHHVVRLYENYTAWPGSLPETKEAVLDSIDVGYHIVHHVGHGYINTMSVGIEDLTLGNGDGNAAANGDKQFLLYAINCTSAAFDFNCIAESYLLNANGGAFAVVGSTRLDFPNTNRAYQNEFFGLVFHRDTPRLGEAMAVAKVPFVSFATQDNAHRWTQMGQVLLGDPSIPLWTDIPATLGVSHPAGFSLGQGIFTVNVTLGGNPLPGATVTLNKENDDYAVATTNGSGQAVIPFRPDTPGSFSVGVIYPNTLPYLGAVTVAAPGGVPYLFAQSQGINDDVPGPSSGNGDGRIDAGETVELFLTLKNNGGMQETLVSATLSSLNPYVTVSDSTSSFPNAGAGASVTTGDPIVVSVSRNAPDRTEARCALTITGSVGTYSQEILLYVHAPIVELRRLAVRDTVGTGNGNGVIAANEDFVLLPFLHNRGLGPAVSVTARLRSTDPAVTVTDSTASLGTLGPAVITGNPADGLAARLSDVSVAHELRLVLLDAHGQFFSTLLDLSPPTQVLNLVPQGTASSIHLSWDPVVHPGLWGYSVYRSSVETGPFSLVNRLVAEGASFFEDENLPALTRYYYQVAAVDSSGNEGPRSAVNSATTSLPLVAGFPVETASATTAGVNLFDLDGDSDLEILGASQEILAVHADGTDYHDGDSDVRTLGPLTSTGSLQYWNTPAVGDVDGDGDPEVAAVSWNGWVTLVDNLGQPLPGWPKFANLSGAPSPAPLGSVCLADVDEDGDLEIFCLVGPRIFAWHHTGAELIDGDANAGTNGVLALTGSAYSFGTPTVANIDEEPKPEILAGMRDGKLYAFQHDGTPYPGFPFVAGGNITSSPVVGDIDRDGRPEIVFGASENAHKVYALRSDLTSSPGFPKTVLLYEDVDPSPALGDINQDGYLDVVISSYQGDVFVFNGSNGSVQPGFPVRVKDSVGQGVPIRGSAVLADVNGDGWIDITVGDYGVGAVHCFDHTGQSLPGFPIRTGNLIENAPAVWDVDGDGLTEIVVESYDQKIYVWDTPWPFNADRAVWPMFKRNPRHTGDALDETVTQIGVPDRLPVTGMALLQNAPNPFLGSTRVSFRVPQDAAGRVMLRVYDLEGRLVRVLADGEFPAGLHEATWDGRDAQGRPAASGVYPYRLTLDGRSLSRKMLLVR